MAYQWLGSGHAIRRRGRGARAILRGFLGDGGAAAIEFGLIFPVFMLMFFGAMEIAFISYANAALEAGARMGSRTALTGVAGSNGATVGMSEAAVRSRIADFALGPLDLSESRDLQLKATIYRTWTDVPEPYDDANGNNRRDADEPYIDVNGNGVFDKGGTPTGTGPGSANEIVVYEVSYIWKSPLPFITSLIVGSDTGRLRLKAVSIVQNEPWGGSATIATSAGG